MIILHIVDVKKPEGNGVAVAVNKYIEYESNENEIGELYLDKEISNVKNSYSYNDYNCINALPKPFNKPDLVVFNEVYKPLYIKLYKECLKLNIPYIIIPHGCLVKEAQKKRRLKKIIGNYLLFNKFIKRAVAIQFLNENEKCNTRFKYKKHIIAGNGIDKKYNMNHFKTKKFVYIGRYSIYHKGLDLIINMVYKNKIWFEKNNITIDLYGRQSGNDLIKLRKYIMKKELNNIILINDPVYNSDKEKILEDSYVFIQCSRYEGQPMGIIEALAKGLPCIVTPGTYMEKEINNNNCGIGISFDEKCLFDAVKYLYENEQERNKMANNAYVYYNKNYNWEKVINQTVKQYKEVLNDI